MELQVIRTIHTIGQGAFYTETLHRPGLNDDKHIVYDCGSMSSTRNLEAEIKNFLPKGSTIDVLFISHFHTDHVNGIKQLAKSYKIKHVVLPQIDDYEWFFIIENYLTTDNADVSVISDVRAAVGDAKPIQVEPIGENKDGVVADEPIVIDSFNGTLINGLSPLVIGSQNFALWHYIVVNPLLKGDLDALKRELQNISYKGRELTIDDLHDPKILTDVRKDLQAAYEKIFKGGNEYSMCMLSELAVRSRHKSFSRYNKRFHCTDCEYCRPRYDDYRDYDVDGGLYCGDADFLHCDTLGILKARLGKRVLNVGLLQLPHHGSIENFNTDLLDWMENLQVTFACYGSPNRYNHPSSDVMGTAGTYSHVVGVNQFKSNVLTERIVVWKRLERRDDK